MAVNNSKSYLPSLNNLVEQYSNTYHHSINKKPINADYSALNENIGTIPKTPKFHVNGVRMIDLIESEILSTNLNLMIESQLLNIRIKIKNINGGKVIGSFYKKYCC